MVFPRRSIGGGNSTTPSFEALTFDSKISAILKYNIRLLKEIGMEIVVEGVETEEVLKQFEEMGCDFIQGYYFSRPLPQQEFVEFIKKVEW